MHANTSQNLDVAVGERTEVAHQVHLVNFSLMPQRSTRVSESRVGSASGFVTFVRSLMPVHMLVPFTDHSVFADCHLHLGSRLGGTKL